MGHQVRSNIHRPREQLFIPSLRDFDFDGLDQDDDGEAPRMRAQRCYYTVVCPNNMTITMPLTIHSSIHTTHSPSIHQSHSLTIHPSIQLIHSDYTDGEFRTPFSSRLWTMRLAVQHGYEALYTVQELQHLLSSPLIASNQLAHAEIVKEIDVAIGLLSQSIGIRTSSSSSSHSSSAFSENFSLDGGHVGAILQTTIGKKLMSRTLKLLTLPYR